MEPEESRTTNEDIADDIETLNKELSEIECDIKDTQSNLDKIDSALAKINTNQK